MNKREFLKSGLAMAATATTRFGWSQSATTVPRENWAGNYHFHTDHVVEPTSVAGVQQAVSKLGSFRALGTRHSFNGIADSTSAQVSTLGLKDIHIDAATKTAVVGAGVKYGDLAVQLDNAGFALANLASLPHISVGGSIATGTHGSGLRNGCLATSVNSLELVSVDGTVHHLSRAKDGDLFHGAVVGLGSLGVVTHVGLDLEPTYTMTQVVYRGLAFDELQHNLEAIMNTGYSLSLFTNWQSHEAWEVWIKRRVDQGGAAPPPATFYGATLATEKLHPVLGQGAEKTTDQLNSVGKWYKRLPHFKMEFTPSTGREIQTEYFIPFDAGFEAMRAVENLRDQITPHLLVTEIRSVAADDLWLSMAYKRRSLAIHFTWKPEAEAVNKLLPQIEARLRPFEPRPHWAKVNTLSADEIRSRYPRAQDFAQLLARFDPNRRLNNMYMRDKLLG